MQIICLAAGDGKRFTESKYEYGRPKPFIEVNGKTIIEHTLDSIPEIKQHNLPITFAVRSEHLMDEYGSFIRNYNENVKISAFPQLTRGNLETAYLTVLQLNLHPDESLLILDSDNKYNNNGLFDYLTNNKPNCLICYFEPLDDSTKWGFVIKKSNVADIILEKDPKSLERGGKPLMGVFYFSKVWSFLREASVVLNGNMCKNEYYMTQLISKLANDRYGVLCHEVTNIIPLGTPEDVEIFRSKGLQ